MTARFRTTRRAIGADQQPDRRDSLVAYLRLLAGGEPATRFLEIRAINRGQVRRGFVAATRRALAPQRVRELAGHRDVYVGVALRTTNQFGGRQAICGSHLAWIEIDSPTAVHTLERFEHPATMVVASGTPGHMHAYWQLRHTYPNHLIERANRQLADRLGGDLASVDIARVLRPPNTLNHKHTPPTPVELITYRPAARYTLAQLTTGLCDPKPAKDQPPQLSRSWVSDPLDVRLRTIPAADYVHALTGRRPDRAGKISCPFHDDTRPSLQLYPGGTFYCFACRFGGTIYDFAAALWLSDQSQSWKSGERLRGRQFTELRERLAAVFAETPPTP